MTQLQSIYGRSVFPSFDQPNFKATFDISLIINENYTALSNIDIKKVKYFRDGYKKVEYNTTPLMSTYLVAFVVDALEYIESSSSRIRIKVWTTPDQKERARFALEIAEKALEFYEQEFEIQYPLSKLDLFAAPDFEKYAMENFGLVIIREDYVLIDLEYASINLKSEVAETIFHEVSQWFGNLATMDFWDELWLNEGFANWISWYAIDKLYPEWKIWESYMVYNLQNALILDVRQSSHPVHCPLNNFYEIEQGFDTISYDKGCYILVMIVKWIGEKLFLKELSEVSGKNIGLAMHTWIKKQGFPVIKVEEDLSNNAITVLQSKFLSNENSDLEDNTELYPVTAYNGTRWTEIGIDAINGRLTVEDRIGVLADYAALALSGQISTVCFLNLINGWQNEDCFYVWDEIINDIYNRYDAFIFGDEDIIDGLKKIILKLISKQIPYCLKINEEDILDQIKFKNLVFSVGKYFGDPFVIEFCKEKFQEFKSDKSKLHPEQRASIFKSIALGVGKI